MTDLGGSGALPWASARRVQSSAASSSVALSPELPVRVVRTSDVAAASSALARPGLVERASVWWHGASLTERAAVVGAGVGVVVLVGYLLKRR